MGYLETRMEIDGFEYELTVGLDVIHDNHFVIPTKDRTKLFNPNGEIINQETGRRILAWLNDGKSQEEALSDRFQEAIIFLFFFSSISTA